MHSKIAGLIAHLLFAAGPQTTSETTANLPWEAIPAASDGTTLLEGAALFHDLRAMRAWGEHVRQELREVPVSAALVGTAADEHAGAAGLPDISEQLQDVDDWLDIAAPGDAPVPAALSVLSSGDDIGWEGAIKLAPGVVERLTKRHAAAVPNEDNTWSLTQRGRTFFVRQDAMGWLRVAADMRWLGMPQGSVPPAMVNAQASFDGSDAAFLVMGNGSIVRHFVQQSPNVATRIAAQNVRVGGFAWRMGDGATTQMRIVLDSPALESLRTALGRRRIADPFSHTLGDDLQTLAIAVIPESFKQAIPPLLSARLAQTAVPLPEQMEGLLRNLDGHIAVATYDAPGDWAMAVRFNAPGFANAVVDELQIWLNDMARAYMAGGQQSIAMEPFAGAPRGVLHLRAAPHLEGPYIAARGSTLLWVQQRSRLKQLLAIDDPVTPHYEKGEDKASDKAPNKGLFAMPMTTMMRSAVGGIHLFSVYHILGGEGVWTDYMTWMANRAQGTTVGGGAKQEPLLTPIMQRLPQWIGALGYLWLCSYDVAITGDVKKSSLVIDITRSEI